jgi:anti-anti-sigma factor
MKVSKTRIIADISGQQAIVQLMPTHVREMSDVQKISDETEEIAYNFNINLLVVNFARQRQLTSAFLGRLITLNKSLGQASISLRVCCLAAQVEKAFKICKLQKIIPIYSTQAKALAG